MKKYLFLFLIGFVVFLAACQDAATSLTPLGKKLELKSCQLSAAGYTQHISAQCGQLEVYEDRQLGSGRKISLNLAVIPAVSRSPELDPVFFFGWRAWRSRHGIFFGRIHCPESHQSET